MITTEEMAKLLLDNLYKRFRLPDKIISDKKYTKRGIGRRCKQKIACGPVSDQRKKAMCKSAVHGL